MLMLGSIAPAISLKNSRKKLLGLLKLSSFFSLGQSHLRIFIVLFLYAAKDNSKKRIHYSQVFTFIRVELRLPPPQAPRFSRKAGEAGEPIARETRDEHARDYGKEKEWHPFPFPSSLARPPLSQRRRRQGTR